MVNHLIFICSLPGFFFSNSKFVLESWWKHTYLSKPSGAAGNMLTKPKTISNLLTFSALQIECAASLGLALMAVMRCDLENSHLMNRWGPQAAAQPHKLSDKKPSEKIMYPFNVKIALHKVQKLFSPFSRSIFFLNQPCPSQNCPPTTPLQGQDLLLFSGSKAESLWGLCLDDLLAM